MGVFVTSMDLGQDQRGIVMGPNTIRSACLCPALKDLGYALINFGNTETPEPRAVEEAQQSEDRTTTGLCEGRGFATAHHGEILQGVFERDPVPSGRLCRALVSLPCHLFSSKAVFSRDPGTRALTVSPEWKVKALRAADLAVDRFGASMEHGGHITINSDVPEGWGIGSSTCDVISAIYAVADAFAKRPTAEEVAELAVAAEGASDSIMFGHRAVLFAHREGLVLEDLGGALPPLEVLGFNADPAGRGVSTLDFAPARYMWREVEAFRPLIGLMRRAVAYQDPYLLGRVSSASARLNQPYLPSIISTKVSIMDRLAQAVGALGISVAHSGTVVALLFDPEDREVDHRMEHAQTLLTKLSVMKSWRFLTGDTNAVVA